MRKCATCRSSRRTATPTRAGMPRTRRSPIPRGCSSFRTTTFSACSTARACRSRRWASRGKDGGAVETDARKIWRKFAENYHLFRGTPTRLWLDQSFCELFGMTVRLSAATADQYFDRISECLAEAGIPPARAVRAVQDRGDRHHREPARSARAPQGDRRIRLEGPRRHRLPARPGDRSGVRRLPARTWRNSATSRAATRSPGTAISRRTGCAAPSSSSTARPRPTTATSRRRPSISRRPMPSGCSRKSSRRISPKAMPSCSARRC